MRSSYSWVRQFEVFIHYLKRMEMLHALKFSYNRSKALSANLIHFREITLLGVIAGSEDNNIFKDVFQVFLLSDTSTPYILLAGLVFNCLVALSFLLIWALKTQKLKGLLSFLSFFIKLYPYIFSVITFYYCFYSIFKSSDIMIRLLAILNIPFLLGYLLLHEFINESLKFREVDFCNQKIGSLVGLVFIPVALIVVHLAGSFFAFMCCSVRAASELLSLFGHCEYVQLQRIKVFYALFTFYLSFIHFLLYFKLFISSSDISIPIVKIGLVTAGVGASWILSKQTVSIIWRKMLRFCKGSGQRIQGQSYDSDLPPIIKIENELGILVQAFLEREAYLKENENSYNYFWRDFNQIVFSHRLRCEEPRCICHKPKDRTDVQVQNEIFVSNLLKRVTAASERLGKEMRLKVLVIYLLIEIAKKPLKGYFQLIILKRQKIKAKLQLQIDDLVSISRECFDQIFFKNKVQNQQLKLLQVIHYEQTIKCLEDDIKQTLMASSNFLQIFRYNTLKMGQVQTEADRLVKMKSDIQKKIETLIVDCYDNPSVNFCIFVFYRFLQPYRSRQAEFKKTAGQQSLKKRLLLKAEGELISSEHGIIYIDLVEDRGRIKKMTSNLCGAFGYSKEDMIGFNINLFMPTIFGKNHAKFLSNFIDKGRIRLLKEKVRVVFAKNKKKFIFPANVRLKAEHLLDNEFGASALISGVDTNSDFMIIGKQGKIEEITQGLFQRVFSKSFREDIHKLCKLCAFKLIPGLNQLVEEWEEHTSKIYDGLFIYSQHQDYLLEKFRCTRDNSYSSVGGGGNKSKSSTLSLVSNSTTQFTFNSKSQRFQFYCDLFKSFLGDINPKRLKAFKISYKYSKVRTAEFEVQVIQFVTSKEELKGKQFMREILNELNNVAEVYQLLEEQSPISQHLLHLEEQIGVEMSLKHNSLGMETKLDGREFVIEREVLLEETQKDVPNYSEQQLFDDDLEEKQPLNCRNSQTSSVAGNTESQSKKQLLINAFNSTEDVIPTIAKVCTVVAVLSLMALLLTMTLLGLQSIEKVQKLWTDNSYLLSLRLAFEFRISLAELSRFGTNLNFPLPGLMALQQDQLSQDMVNLCQLLSTNTGGSDLSNNPYSYYTPIYDPNRNLIYNSSFPESIMKLAQLFTDSSPSNKQTVRYNYEGLHQNFTNFFNLRLQSYKDQNKKQDILMTALLAIYEVLIGVVVLSSIPMYIYFKRQELAVRSKLAFMSQRQIKKALGRTNIVLQFFKQTINKTAINRLQYQLIQRKYQKQEETTGSKIIKINSESDDYKMFRNPWVYCILILNFVFFSNLAVSLYAIFQRSNHFFLNALVSHQLANNLEIKTPLLVNVYVSNLNRALEGTTPWVFKTETIDETQTKYFSLIKELTLPQYTDNGISQYISNGSTVPICQAVQCLSNSDLSLVDVSQSFKYRFNYWDPSNQIVPNITTISAWLTQNSILTILSQLGYVLMLSLKGEDAIDAVFKQEQDWLWRLALMLSALLIPINIFGLALILRKYLVSVNRMVKSAEQLYMNFPVQVLVENTYLTSYFTSKIKSGK